MFRLAFIFMLVWLVLTWFAPSPKEEQEQTDSGITVETTKEDYPRGQLVQFELQNETAEQSEVQLQLEARKKGEWQKLEVENDIYSLQPGEKRIVVFEEQNVAFFGENGKYRFQAVNLVDNEFIAEQEFAVGDPGIFRALWRGVFFKPIENALILLLEFSGHYLWLAIVLLTIVVKLILLVPSKRAIIAQQKMQKVQPELEKVRKQYASDPQLQAQEMMKLWKKHKVNPGSALWPVIIQFPILIALFFVVKEGLAPHNSYLLYPVPFLQNFDFTLINFHFLWMSLDKPDPYIILPLTIGLLQFVQLKTMNVRQKKRKAAGGNAEPPTQQEQMMKMMSYMLPGIVVFFSATLPAAVGLYWGVSTLFSIVQQEVIHRKTEQDEKPQKGDEIIVEAKEVSESTDEKKVEKKSAPKKKPSKKKGKK